MPDLLGVAQRLLGSFHRPQVRRLHFRQLIPNGATVIVLGNTDPMPEQVAIDVCELVHRS